jgi:hypothetical protein
MSSETLDRDRKYDGIFAALAAPFAAHEVKSRTQAGREMQYVTARTVENRLDEVIGAAYWWDDYTPGENSVMCRLTIELPDGRRVTKVDAGGYAGMPDQGDDDKSGFSDAIKRTAARFGVGRYLYRDGVPDYAREHHGEVADRRQPAPARPNGQPPRREPERPREDRQHDDRPRQQGQDNAPRTGRALFAWVKRKEEEHGTDLLAYLNNFIKLNNMPPRMVDLDQEEVARVHKEAIRKIQSASEKGDAYEEALAN